MITKNGKTVFRQNENCGFCFKEFCDKYSVRKSIITFEDRRIRKPKANNILKIRRYELHKTFQDFCGEN